MPTLDQIHTLAEIVGIVVALCAALGSLCGAAWWASSMFHEVKATRAGIDEIKVTLREEKLAIWGKLDEHERRLDGHDLTLAGLRGTRP